MARKLKSDKLLFTATLLLVCTSIVMVYSASAVIATEKWQEPYLFLFKQAAWVLIGLSLVPIVMRIDYRCYRQPVVIWTGLGGGRGRARRRALRAPGERRQPLAARRSARRPALGAREDWRSSSSRPRSSSGAWIASTSCPTRCSRSAWPPASSSALILVEPDLGTAVSVLVIAGAMVFAAGISYRYVFGLALVAVPALYRRGDGVSPTACSGSWRSSIRGAIRRAAGYQVIQSMIAVGTGGFFGTRPDGRHAEALLPARAAQRLHLRRHRRGARPDRRHHGARSASA